MHEVEVEVGVEVEGRVAGRREGDGDVRAKATRGLQGAEKVCSVAYLAIAVPAHSTATRPDALPSPADPPLDLALDADLDLIC